MKRVLVKSVYDTFEYVMDHFYPAGFKDMAIRNDSYVLISIQDTSNGGFGFEFRKNTDAETLVVHCHAGQSRSRAVGAFAVKMLGADNRKYFENGSPNMHVYNLLLERYEEKKT